MSTRWYDSALEAALTGALDLVGGDPLTISFVDATYVFDQTDNFFDDIVGMLGTPFPLTSVAVSGGDVSADNGLVTGLSGGDVVKGIVVYQDSGVAGTSALVGFIDRNADSSPISLTSDGSDVNVPWPSGFVARLVAV